MTHVWAEKCVTKEKIALNCPLVTQFWEICVTRGMSGNLTVIPCVTHFPLVTQLFSAKKCVTRGMSAIYEYKTNENILIRNLESNLHLEVLNRSDHFDDL